MTLFVEMEQNETYMRRALELARMGMGFASPNPMVGAVIVAPDGRVIGEGWHRKCGEAHAEVNAVASVSEADRPLLRRSTMYVTLEPCSHYGKTPPCAELIVRTGIPRVVVATEDPFAKVCGRGIAMLRDAGIDVEVGLLGEESRALNRRFFLAHKLRRPFITLKWARSYDGFMDWCRQEDSCGQACRFSTPLTILSTMRLRSLHDAVLTTATTVNADDSRLTVRMWDGCQPMRVVLDLKGILKPDATLLQDECDCRLIIGRNTAFSTVPHMTVLTESGTDSTLALAFQRLYSDYGVTSVLVEAGPRLLGSLISDGLWDEAREEIAPFELGERGMCPAPELAFDLIVSEEKWGENIIFSYSKDRKKRISDRVKRIEKSLKMGKYIGDKEGKL